MCVWLLTFLLFLASQRQLQVLGRAQLHQEGQRAPLQMCSRAPQQQQLQLPVSSSAAHTEFEPGGELSKIVRRDVHESAKVEREVL